MATTTQLGERDVEQPVLDKSTLRGFRLYEFKREDREDTEGEGAFHISLWAVHGNPQQSREVEYPVATYDEGGVIHNSADPTFGEEAPDLLGDVFYEYVAGQAARIAAEDPENVFHTMTAFAPDEWADENGHLGNEVWAAEQLLLMVGQGDDDGNMPFEAKYALDRGVEHIEENLEASDVETDFGESDDV